ncbi:hypothetical protein NECAME_04150 [Necator americanus]|uniref:Uncharacterized protein n=1 Tax=Necator americanus TaxID=51031 RepID=W2SYU4_NECAM|nr:hypothetical protein NECAME_04150 [Necator americanus]ETN74121.1 hypothetical protein NECAME_04150 [Necator americanus]
MMETNTAAAHNGQEHTQNTQESLMLSRIPANAENSAHKSYRSAQLLRSDHNTVVYRMTKNLARAPGIG